MKVNLHTHTYRCNHAVGTEREYIENAISGGIKVLGFSDHAPFVFPDGHESGYRLPISLAKDYFDTLSALKEEYKDKIEIHIGFEMEYYPLYFEDMLKTVKDAGAEYLILGQHFIGNEYPERVYSYSEYDDMQKLCEYTDCIIGGMKTGKFTYIAHPDIISFTGDRDIYIDQVRRLCRASNEYDVPLEINFLGIREDRKYPKELFWKIAGEEKCKTVLGFDAHTPADANDKKSEKIAEEIVKKYGLCLLSEPKIRKIQ